LRDNLKIPNCTSSVCMYVCKQNAKDSLSIPLAKIISKLGPTTNFRAVLVKEHRRRHERKTQESQHAGGPLRSQVAVHVRSKQRKDGGDETADESVCRQGGVGLEQVDVDEVDDGGHEDHDDLIERVSSCVNC
jgi:hypothetical protein